MKFIRPFLLLLLNLPFFRAQQPSYFVIGKEQFEGTQIFGMIQDLRQNYWFATDEGIYKYDGYDFKKTECAGMKGLSAFGFVINKNGTIFCHNLNHQILKIENDTCTVFYELSETERSSDMSLAISADNHLLVTAKIPLIFNEQGKLIRAWPQYTGPFGSPFTRASKSTSSMK